MSKKSKPKEYRIASFEDLCNTITVENRERLLKDVTEAFTSYLTMIEEIRAQHPEETKGQKNWEILQYEFDWVDDGKHEWIATRIETDKASIEIKHK